MVLVSTHTLRISQFAELHGSKLLCMHTRHYAVHVCMHRVCGLHGPTAHHSHRLYMSAVSYFVYHRGIPWSEYFHLGIRLIAYSKVSPEYDYNQVSISLRYFHQQFKYLQSSEVSSMSESQLLR